MSNDRAGSVKQVGAGLSIIIFPITLLMGFVMHSNIFSFDHVRRVP